MCECVFVCNLLYIYLTFKIQIFVIINHQEKKLNKISDF